MWVSCSKLALLCLLHTETGGAIFACVHECVMLILFVGLGGVIVTRYNSFVLEEDKRVGRGVVVPVQIFIICYKTSMLQR